MDRKLIQEINERTPILDLVSEFVTLQKTGKNYRGLCPFHQEKTPSFFVSPEKNISKCYGCGEGGNPINFYRKIKNISFQEAAYELAKRAGIEMKDLKQKRDPYAHHYEMMAEAKAFYQYNLKNSEKGQTVLKYLEQRELLPKTIDHFELGYAPEHSQSLYQLLNDKGFLVSDMIQLGLVKQREDGSYYDLFSHRLMFPITNPKGQVVGFSGRSLNPKDLAKYVNSPESVIFKKSQLLYHFHEALSEIRKNKQIVLYEGFFDVISSYQAGIENGVAAMGTSLTLQQAKLMRQATSSLVIAYDGDQAGMNAVISAIPVIERAGLKIEVLSIPEKMDPDDFIRAYGADQFETLFGEYLLDPYQFRYQYYKMGKDLTNANDIVNFKNDILKMLANADEAIQNLYKGRLSKDLQVSPDSLIIRKTKREPIPPQVVTPEKKEIQEPNKYGKAEIYLIYAMLRSKKTAQYIQSQLKGSDFVDHLLSIVRHRIDSFYKKHEKMELELFLETLTDDQRAYMNEKMFVDLVWTKNLEISAEDIDLYIYHVQRAYIIRRISYLKTELEKADYENPKLQKEYEGLLKKRSVIDGG